MSCRSAGEQVIRNEEHCVALKPGRSSGHLSRQKDRLAVRGISAHLPATSRAGTR